MRSPGGIGRFGRFQGKRISKGGTWTSRSAMALVNEHLGNRLLYRRNKGFGK